ncbi:MAG: hypothetical protein JXR73_05275 [Candidatus Omnitrophica bacterium]|nr:hypothetical protein [Candidatus Omnitrophota bacterium]
MDDLVLIGVVRKVQDEQGGFYYERSPAGDAFQKLGKEIQAIMLFPGDSLPTRLTGASQDDLFLYVKVSPKSKSRASAGRA